MSRNLIFVQIETALLIHEKVISRYGGDPSIRDMGALESAIQAPQFRQDYQDAGLAICAGTYAYHICKAHAFIDGNKRTAAGVAEVFVEANDAVLTASDDLVYELIMGIADGTINRDQVEQFYIRYILI